MGYYTREPKPYKGFYLFTQNERPRTGHAYLSPRTSTFVGYAESVEQVAAPGRGIMRDATKPVMEITSEKFEGDGAKGEVIRQLKERIREYRKANPYKEAK